jgi:hypothetical protein
MCQNASKSCPEAKLATQGRCGQGPLMSPDVAHQARLDRIEIAVRSIPTPSAVPSGE